MYNLGVAYRWSYAEAQRLTGFALRTSVKLCRCSRKTRTQRTADRRPGPIAAGAMVRWKARMLKIWAANRMSARDTKYPESSSSPATSCTAKKKAEKCEVVLAIRNCKAIGFVGGG